MAKIKKLKSVLITSLATVCMLSSCAMPNNQTGGSNSQTNNEPHVHDLIKLSSRKPTCLKEGRLAYWYCEDCDSYFLDHKAKNQVSLEETVVEKLPHTPTKTDGVEATCSTSGAIEYWTCSECNHFFSDEACTVEVEKSQIQIGVTPHTLTHVDAVPVVNRTDGVKEHWVCSECDGYFADEDGLEEIEEEDTVAYALLNIPDFLVEVPAGRDPVVLQLSDTQIIDAGQIRPGDSGVDRNFYATDKIEDRCLKYVRETIEATNPDLIILTGDIVYGKFDDSGRVWTMLVEFFDSFQIPWAPIFGNHDGETAMGIDWQCEQLENAEYCLFEQKELTGNSNYSVGIVQGEELKRVFYMLDSNGVGSPSEATLANGHTTNIPGIKQDQIDWYTKQINRFKEISPDTKVSFAYHIQNKVFEKAYAGYGYDDENFSGAINIDTLPNKAEGDFGLIGSIFETPWDESGRIFQGMKDLGADSIFVGHEHAISASVVYQGVRLQFGQKSSQYDFCNYVDANGNIASYFSPAPSEIGAATPLIGGTVIVLSEEDGSIENGYIYYCEEAGGKLNLN